MTLLYILLPLFGALPVLIVYFKMRNALRIKRNGILTDAEVVQINLLPRRAVSLVLSYKAGLKQEIFNGKATAAYGQHKIGDTIPVYYLPENPSKMSLQNQQGYYPLLIFAILIFLFVLVVTFQLPEIMEQNT